MTIGLQPLTMEVWHKAYNLDEKDNLGELPSEKAVYGIFAIVNEEPVNCRFVGATDNLQEAIRDLFENPKTEGLKKFMQGPWIQMLVYEPMAGSSWEQRDHAAGEWKSRYQPGIDEEGEYPGYYGQE